MQLRTITCMFDWEHNKSFFDPFPPSIADIQFLSLSRCLRFWAVLCRGDIQCWYTCSSCRFWTATCSPGTKTCVRHQVFCLWFEYIYPVNLCLRKPATFSRKLTILVKFIVFIMTQQWPISTLLAGVYYSSQLLIW